MNLDRPIKDVVIAGAGIAGWSVAAALKRRIPSLNVTIAGSIPPDSIVDRVISTLPSIMSFHEQIGLTDVDAIGGARSGLRVGTRFEGWASGSPAYVHAYGPYGRLAEGVPFHQVWLRARRASPVEPFDHFSAAAELGRQGKLPPSEPTAAVGEVGVGLRLTMPLYVDMMRAFALHLGAVERRCDMLDVDLRPTDGFVEELRLSDGTSVTGDLFVDCTGQTAMVRSRMNGDFREWRKWLPCDHVAFASAPPHQRDADLLDSVAAFEAGWSWSASSPGISSAGVAYSSVHARPEDALPNLPYGDSSTVTQIGLRQGRWAQPWVRNCVAIGDSAVAVEPLEWTNLNLVHKQIDRLVSMMPGRDCAAIETAEYNRQSNAEADRVRDFICMHYVTSRRDEPFWMDAAAMEPPDSLAHTLALYTERGRIPFYEEETFSRDGWLAVLLGQGLEPRRTDPLADILGVDDVHRLLSEYRSTLRSFVAAQPSYRDSVSERSGRVIA